MEQAPRLEKLLLPLEEKLQEKQEDDQVARKLVKMERANLEEQKKVLQLELKEAEASVKEGLGAKVRARHSLAASVAPAGQRAAHCARPVAPISIGCCHKLSWPSLRVCHDVRRCQGRSV